MNEKWINAISDEPIFVELKHHRLGYRTQVVLEKICSIDKKSKGILYKDIELFINDGRTSKDAGYFNVREFMKEHRGFANEATVS